MTGGTTAPEWSHLLGERLEIRKKDGRLVLRIKVKTDQRDGKPYIFVERLIPENELDFADKLSFQEFLALCLYCHVPVYDHNDAGAELEKVFYDKGFQARVIKGEKVEVKIKLLDLVTGRKNELVWDVWARPKEEIERITSDG